MIWGAMGRHPLLIKANSCFTRQFRDIEKKLGPERPSFFIYVTKLPSFFFIYVTKLSRKIKLVFHHQMRLFSIYIIQYVFAADDKLLNMTNKIV